MAVRTAYVVGGGVMGLASACALARRGVAVTVLEQHGIGHAWASSHGLSRAIRHEYGPHAIYTAMVARSLEEWATLARETGRTLYTETGVLTLGQPGDGHTLEGLEVMRAADLPVQRLTAEECRARFPQFVTETFGAITYNARGGMLYASECLAALAQRLRALGGTIQEATRVAAVEPLAGHARVVLADERRLEADRVVVTAGPWAPELLRELRLPVRATRQQVCYFSGLPHDAFALGRFPVFLAGMEYYGFPQVGPVFKVGCHTFGAATDPDAPYPPDAGEVDAVRTFLRRVIPGAAEGMLNEVDRCMYDVTPDEDFILDAHPGGGAVILGSGFSGHGFKFGPVIGELLASLALDEPPAFPLDRFRLSRFASA